MGWGVFLGKTIEDEPTQKLGPANGLGLLSGEVIEDEPAD